RRERAEALSELDLQVDDALHVGIAGIAQDAPRSECPRTELHPALKPADHLAVGHALRDTLAECSIVADVHVVGADAVQERPNLLVGVLRAEQRSSLRVLRF